MTWTRLDPEAWAQVSTLGALLDSENVDSISVDAFGVRRLKLTSLGIGLFCTGHLDTVQDGLTKRLSKTPLLTGRLKKSIPLLFSEILGTTTESDNKGGILFKMQTKPDSMFQTCRTSIKGLNAVEDVTIDFKKSPVGQGIVMKLQFVIPDKMEQKRISDTLSYLSNLINSEKIYREKLLRQRSGLMHDLLAGTKRTTSLIKR
jgi:hypothetical protein